MTAPLAGGEFTLYCDGASRGNPGAAAIGYALFDPGGEEILGRGAVIGIATNNIAEYQALLQGLEAAAAHGIENLRVRMDSELVVRQVLGRYRVRNAGLMPLHAAAMTLRGRFRRFVIEHVPRAQNARADALANAALDALASGST
jgi:ribonuclease HI